MKCTQCGAELLASQKFCGTCGKEVEVDNSKVRKCHSCSSLIKLGQKFCTNCGKPVDICQLQGITFLCKGKIDGSQCNAELSQTDGFCSKCGTKKEEQKCTDETSDPSPENNGIGENLEKELDDKSDCVFFIEEDKQTPLVTHPTENPVVDKNSPHHGLVVICYHTKFNKNTYNLENRPSAENDAEMMKEAWELYGCKVVEFRDEDNKFYNDKLKNEIEEALKTIPNIRLFVFVLSTHGEEKFEATIGSREQQVQHYFFTKDNQLNTQNLMNKISEIKKLRKKLKLFVIQACRSRSGDQNEDDGYDLEVTGFQNEKDVHPVDGIDMEDAKGLPPEDEVHIHIPPGFQTIAEHITELKEGEAHAKGYMANENEGNIHVHPKESTGSKITTDQIIKVDESETTDDILELIPHCDDCIVLFASMGGKYAYKKTNSLKWSGGWLIKALYDNLHQNQSQKKVYLLDILTEVNSKVGKRKHVEKSVKAQSCFFHNIAFDEEDLYLVKSHCS